MFETGEKSALERKIAKARHLVLFYAGWCPDCARFMPVFDSLPSSTNLPLLKARIDEDENPMWDHYGIERVPTLILFENGKEKGRAEEKGGRISEEELKKLLR
jgi:thioredoxin-like negative regulator of GroEL